MRALGRDGVAGIVCMAGALVLLALTRGLPHNPLVPIGPAFYPRILLVITAILGGALVVVDVRAGRSGRRVTAAAANYRLVILAFAIFTGYVALLPTTGYRIATFVFLAVMQAVLDPPRRARAWAVILAVALGTTIVSYSVFEGYLSVLLPRGRLTGF